MRTILRFSWLALLVAGLSAPVAQANKDSAKPQDGVMKVEDKAGAFTDSGIDTAKAKFDGTTFKARTHLTVATRSSVPESKKRDLDATKGNNTKASAFFSDWAHEIRKAEGEVGVFVLAYMEGDKFFVKAIADRGSDKYRNLTDSNLTKLEGKLIESFRAAKAKSGDEAKKTRDAGLLEAATYVIDELKDTSLPADTKLKSDEHKETGGMSILGWVCIIGAVLLGVWILIALIRMMTGSVNGYGGGMGGGMGGGGGMGFMGGMMGGMFGAMAGMYLYDQFTGGHHYNDNYGGGSDGSGGGDTGGDSGGTGEGDFSGGSEGTGGGDWGDSGGGDTGGGGDWGGDSGGDFGGGGDW